MQFRSIRECYFCRKNIDMLTSSANIYMRDVAENHKEYRYVCGRYAVGVPSWLLVCGAGLTRVRHDAEAWVPVAGCGMVLHGAENRKAVSLIITLYYAVVQGFTGLYKEGVPKVRSCIIDRITCQ